MRFLFSGLLAIIFVLSFGTAAEARRGGYATSEELLFVAPTQIENDGATMSLCHLVKTNAVIIVNFWRSLEGYALAENGCMTDSYYVLTDTQFKQFQSAGLITADIPQTPKLSVAEMAGGFWGFGILAALVVFVGLKSWNARVQKKKRFALMKDSSAGAKAILDAMCHAAKSDGRVDPAEIAVIQDVARQMTEETFELETVKTMIDLAAPKLDENGYKRLIKGCSKEIQLDMMRAVLMVVAADGRLDGHEKAFVGGLAKVMKMQGDVVSGLLSEVVGQPQQA